MNWQRVRGLSQLTVLNRLALALLVLVPILASFWPTIDRLTGGYNRAVDSVRSRIGLSEEFPAETDVLQSGSEGSAAGGGEDNLLQSSADQSPRNLGSDATESKAEAIAAPQPAADETQSTGLAASDAPANESRVESTAVESDAAREVTDDRLVENDVGDGSTPDSRDEETTTTFARGTAGVRTMLRGLQSRTALLEARMDAYLFDFFPRTKQPPNLPRTWAIAFFSALCILVADTLMQLFCPRIVRHQGRSDYVRTQKADFADAPSQAVLASALVVAEQDQAMRRMVREEQVDAAAHAQRLSRLQSRLDSIEESLLIVADKTSPTDKQATAPSGDDLLDQDHTAQYRRLHELYLAMQHRNQQDSGQHDARFRRRMALIQYAAEQAYDLAAVRYPLAMLGSAACYVAAGACIFRILFEQAYYVSSAAGWL